MFVQILNEVTKETTRQCQAQGSNSPDYLFFAIRIWCSELEISEDETNYILRGYNQHAIRNFMWNIYEEGITEKKIISVKKQTLLGEETRKYPLDNTFYKHIKALFEQVNITMVDVKFIVLLAFGVTAVGYCIYRLNHSKQKQTSGSQKPRQDNSNPPSFTGQTTTVQASTKRCLVLVVSATQEDFLRSLESEGQINVSDGEELCNMTKYLWQGSETVFNQKIANINQYEVSKGEESEFDICLVYIKLKQADKGFESNVDKLDRYDAFRKLDRLVDSFKVFSGLQMEAYGNFEVYNR